MSGMSTASKCPSHPHPAPSPPPQYRTYKVIYRRYAGLFFSMCIDVSDNELALIEAIHLFVEILDHYFENVCELDLVFNFHKVGEGKWMPPLCAGWRATWPPQNVASCCFLH